MPTARAPVAPAPAVVVPVDSAHAAGLAVHNAVVGAAPAISRVVSTLPVVGAATGAYQLAKSVPGFLGGLLGSSGSATDATPVTAAAAGTQALAQGKQAMAAVPIAPPATPQSALSASLVDALSKGVSADNFSKVVAAVPAATRLPVTNKDQIFGQTSALYDAMYQKGLADAAKTNSVDSPEYAKAFDKLTQNLAMQKANLISNDQHLASAQLLTQQPDQ